VPSTAKLLLSADCAARLLYSACSLVIARNSLTEVSGSCIETITLIKGVCTYHNSSPFTLVATVLLFLWYACLSEPTGLRRLRILLARVHYEGPENTSGAKRIADGLLWHSTWAAWESQIRLHVFAFEVLGKNVSPRAFCRVNFLLHSASLVIRRACPSGPATLHDMPPHKLHLPVLSSS
jgi:hypothetical protein